MALSPEVRYKVCLMARTFGSRGRLGDKQLDRFGEALVGMLDQDVALADGREYVDGVAVGARQACRRDRDERLLLELGPVEVVHHPQSGQVQRAGDGVDVLGLQIELPGEKGAHLVGDRRIQLEAHGPTEPAPAQLHLDRLQEVVGVLLLEGQVGVAGDPERVVALDLHAGEQGPEMGGDDLLHGDESLAVGHGQQPGQHRRNLDAGEAALTADRVPDDDGQVERQIGDVGKRVTGIDRERGEDRKDPLDEHFPNPGAVIAVKGFPFCQPDGMIGETRQDVVEKRGPAPLEQGLHLQTDGGQLVGHRQAVGRRPGNTGRLLVLEAGDANLEELVHVGGKDGQELDPLQQRDLVVFGEGQDPAVEFECRQLPVDVPVLAVDVGGQHPQQGPGRDGISDRVDPGCNHGLQATASPGCPRRLAGRGPNRGGGFPARRRAPPVPGYDGTADRAAGEEVGEPTHADGTPR